jgi:protein TonB
MTEKPVRFRFTSLLIAALVHLLLLFLTVVTIKTAAGPEEPRSGVMKLADIQEEAPPPEPRTKTPVLDSDFAETVIETDVLEPHRTDGEMSSIGKTGETTEYLPMHSISVLPRFSEEEIKKRIIYPPIAQRAGITGTVYLELFVDSRGLVQNISILKEDPPGRGFGEAAIRAFQGLAGSPALANGEEVAVRYRYPVRFSLK